MPEFTVNLLGQEHKAQKLNRISESACLHVLERVYQGYIQLIEKPDHASKISQYADELYGIKEGHRYIQDMIVNGATAVIASEGYLVPYQATLNVTLAKAIQVFPKTFAQPFVLFRERYTKNKLETNDQSIAIVDMIRGLYVKIDSSIGFHNRENSLLTTKDTDKIIELAMAGELPEDKDPGIDFSMNPQSVSINLENLQGIRKLTPYLGIRDYEERFGDTRTRVTDIFINDPNQFRNKTDY